MSIKINLVRVAPSNLGDVADYTIDKIEGAITISPLGHKTELRAGDNISEQTAQRLLLDRHHKITVSRPKGGRQ